MTVYNSGERFRDLEIAGHIYTVMPHQVIKVKAPAGTPIYIEKAGASHHRGDLLFSLEPAMQNKRIQIN